MKEITLKQTVTFKVIFSEDDFETEKKWIEFVDNIKTNEEFMVECFIENVNRENLNDASEITIEY